MVYCENANLLYLFVFLLYRWYFGIKISLLLLITLPLKGSREMKVIMKVNAMSLKAKIRNLAKLNNISAQVVLQNFMFERFLERLSKSKYQDKFILKGGLLTAAMVGINNRSTMDMYTTLKNYPLMKYL